MTPVEYALLLLLGLEIKHYIADYLLQFDWMIRGKNSFAKPGGYAHVAIHAAGTILIFTLLAVPALLAAALVVGEVIIHYLLDHAKARNGGNISNTEHPRVFWALNGLDQLLHHLTYIGLTYVVVAAG